MVRNPVKVRLRKSRINNFSLNPPRVIWVVGWGRGGDNDSTFRRHMIRMCRCILEDTFVLGEPNVPRDNEGHASESLIFTVIPPSILRFTTVIPTPYSTSIAEDPSEIPNLPGERTREEEMINGFLTRLAETTPTRANQESLLYNIPGGDFVPQHAPEKYFCFS